MAITKEASHITANTLPVYYTPSARDAFARILRQINFSDDEYLFLPSYIGITDKEGSGVFDPVRNSNIKYDFYKVDNKLGIDYTDITEKVENTKIKAILIIHYFGFFQKNTLKLRQLCDEKGIILIEDCAHAMDSFYRPPGSTLIGKMGEYAFYSIHKYLPAKDGGFYTYIKNAHTHSHDNGISISLATLYAVTIADYEKIRNKRISNYKYMLELLHKKNKKYAVLFPRLPKGTVPLNFPIIIHNKKREPVYFKLIENKVMVISSYYRMIKQIDRDMFPVSYSISDSILNFPTHQDIENKDLLYMVNVFNRIMEEI